MLDDLRNDAKSSFEDTPELLEDENDLAQLSPRRRQRPPFLGMSPAQRFLLALLLFLMVCVLGAFCLIVFEKIVLPI
ncbi:MAG TPA: hypothetical protein PJ988_01425 [Anaerolinea sp.]|nr:hypothetical protein [Anaerolinea sp.]